MTFRTICLGLVLLGPLAAFLWAAPVEEDDTRFCAMALSGSVTVYHDELDETVRMKVKDYADDGDNLFTSAKSNVLLRLPGKGYVYLGPHTNVHISRLRATDKGLQVRLNLLTGTLWCQLDQAPRYPFEISAKSLIVRCHGTLVQVERQSDAVRITTFDGPAVTVSHARVKLAKSGEVMQYIKGQFRYKHRLKASDEEHLTQWQAYLNQMKTQKPR